jgi:hypothetical protein
MAKMEGTRRDYLFRSEEEPCRIGKKSAALRRPVPPHHVAPPTKRIMEERTEAEHLAPTEVWLRKCHPYECLEDRVKRIAGQSDADFRKIFEHAYI